MNSYSITSVVTEGGIARCITATASIAPGKPGITIRGVTDAAARDIRRLVMVAAARRDICLPRKAITVDLAFDVPFERTSELCFAALLSITETICPSCIFPSLSQRLEDGIYSRQDSLRALQA